MEIFPRIIAITSRDIKITGVRMIKDTRYDRKVGEREGKRGRERKKREKRRWSDANHFGERSTS